MILVDMNPWDDWQDWAACAGVSPDESSSGVGRVEILHNFAIAYCFRCPVAQQCLDSSYFTDHSGRTVDDNLHTVRGGYLPTGQSHTPPGRPRKHRVEEPRPGSPVKWRPKEPPLTPRYGLTILERGICTRGLHGIESEEDILRGRGCRACKIESSVRYRAGKAAAPRVPENRTHCPKGLHLWIPENFRHRRGGSNISCRVCENEQQKIKDSQSCKMGE